MAVAYYLEMMLNRPPPDAPAAPSSAPLGVDSDDNSENIAESEHDEAVSDSESVAAASENASEYEDDADPDSESDAEGDHDHESDIKTRSSTKRKADDDIDTAIRKSAKSDSYDDDKSPDPAFTAAQPLNAFPTFTHVSTVRALFDYVNEADRQNRERQADHERQVATLQQQQLALERERNRSLDIARDTLLRSIRGY